LAAYESSDDRERRLLNQAFFKKLLVFDDQQVQAELAEPYDMLLNPTLRARAAGLIEGEVREVERDDAVPLADKSARKGKPRRAEGRRGFNNETLVGAGGFEPP
jgi:hypothetical protein